MDEPSAIDLLASILAAVRAGNAGRYLAPWDANEYFDLPITSLVSLPGGTVVQALTANPYRIAVLFSCVPAASATCYITPNNDVNANNGYGLVAQTPSVAFTHGEFGQLVAGEWWAQVTGSQPAALWICQLVLHKWTDGG